MLWRLKHKFPANISFVPSKLLRSSFAIHQLAKTTECSKDKSFTFKRFSHQQELHEGPKIPFLNINIVRATLQNCPSDLVALSYFLWCGGQPQYFHDKLTFHHMVPVVSNLTQRHGTVKRIIEELETVGCITKAQTFLLLMRIFWFGSMYDMVVEAFKEMINYGYTPNTYVRNIVMDVLFKIGNVDVALRVLEESETPNFLSFNIAVCNLCRLNDFHGVKVVLRCMLREGYHLKPETYSLVFNCFAKLGRLAEAWQLLGLMIVLGAPISVYVWSILIDGFCKSGKIDVGAYLLELMVKMGCSPNIVTCTSLIKGFLESQMPGKAFEILGTLESNGYFPDLVLCNVLIDCLSKMGWYNDAFKVFSSLRDRKLMPDVYTYSSLVSAICLSREYVLLPLLTSGLSIEPDLVVCNSLLSYFCKAGYPEGSVEFYGDIIEKGFLPDKYTFAAVLSALCRLGRVQEAVDVYHGMIRSHKALDAHIHTIVINGLIQSGQFHKALKLFGEAVAKKYLNDVMSYNVVISGLLRAGRTKEAYVLFSQMKQMDIVPNTQSYNLILSGFCERRDFNIMTHILLEMVERNIKLDGNSYKLMRNFLRGSHHSLLSFDLFNELRTCGLLPEEAHKFFDDGRGVGFAYASDPRDVPDPGASSSDDLSDALVCVG